MVIACVNVNLCFLIDCKVCQTEVCKKLAKELKITIDKNVDPCDDFGSHICGNYDKHYSIPPGENLMDSLLHMTLEITKELKDLIGNTNIFN